jgi:hypothetical protein
LLTAQHVVLVDPQHDLADSFAAQQLTGEVDGRMPDPQPQSFAFKPNGCKNSIAMADHANSCFTNSVMGLLEYTIRKYFSQWLYLSRLATSFSQHRKASRPANLQIIACY